ncbi:MULTISPECIES: hypothetical protein [Clostridium]|jgi:hypothetical protein|uniref:hypothetical protein n=1 Tax=Clostridium TaxID=1485 RepID=UPI00242DF773|nr:hypothetical protein [Clostridium tyrobutyricum]
MDIVVKRYCNVEESLAESLKQMQSIRKGDLPAKTWKDFKKDFQEEEKNSK